MRETGQALLGLGVPSPSQDKSPGLAGYSANCPPAGGHPALPYLGFQQKLRLHLQGKSCHRSPATMGPGCQGTNKWCLDRPAHSWGFLRGVLPIPASCIQAGAQEAPPTEGPEPRAPIPTPTLGQRGLKEGGDSRHGLPAHWLRTWGLGLDSGSGGNPGEHPHPWEPSS